MEKSLPSIDDLKERSTHDLVLSDEEIKQREIEIGSLFQIKINDEIQGPILKEDLQEYVQFNDIEQLEVKNLASGSWTPITNHPLFQRRKPKIVTSATIEEFESPIYILKNGEKSGPFDTKEIIEKFEKEELLVTDMISQNGINNWKKLYEVKEFDRRNYQQLPHLPKNEVFKMTAPILEEEENYQQAEIEAIVGLAYVSNIKSGMKESTYENTQAKVVSENLPNISVSKTQKSYLKPLAALSLVIAFLASYIFISNLPSNHGPQVTKQKTASYSIKNKQPRVHKLKPKQRRPAAIAREIKPVRARIKQRNINSFKENPAYKKYKKQQAVSEVVSQELDAEEFEPEYPQDEVNMDEEMDDISDEEVQEFVKSIHGGFSIRAQDTGDEVADEDELLDQEEVE